MNLREIRKSLGFSVDEVASRLGLGREPYRELERDSADGEVDAEVADQLSDLFGLDVAAALEEDFPGLTPVQALLKSNSAELPADTRFAIASAASVGRDYSHLRAHLDPSAPCSGWERVRAFRDDGDYRHPEEGAPERLAQRVRDELELGEGPIESVYAVLRSLDILVIWEDLVRDLDAVSMASPEVGAVVLSNTRGDHMRAAPGRRITWAHELCHLLFDRSKMLEIRRFCAVSRPPKRRRCEGDELWERVEQRARAFAVYFLAPRTSVLQQWERGGTVEARVRRVMDLFGLGYEATRSHLDNLRLLKIRARIDFIPPELPGWEEREPGPDAEPALLALGVPAIRAGAFGQAVVKHFRASETMTSGQAAGLLRVHPFLLQRDYLQDHRR